MSRPLSKPEYRSVRITDECFEDIARQLPPETAMSFVGSDLATSIDRLAAVGAYEDLPDHSVGRRLTVEPGQTVGAFHLFATLTNEGEIVIFAADIWNDGFPTETD